MDNHRPSHRKTHIAAERPRFERIALLLQGGGAFGAYQAGVYQALADANLHSDWGADARDGPRRQCADIKIPACRLHAAHWRVGALLHGRRHRKGSLGQPGRNPAFRRRVVRCRRLPVREVVSAIHYVTDLTLGLGEAVFDYLQES